jgi:molybdopterin synthase sulfur carrier subunit
VKTTDESNRRAITVEYFAILREQRGLTRETLTTAASTPAALYGELHGRHGFSLPAHAVRAAVNGVLVKSDAPLRDGDLVVFIPPVAGG